MKLAFFELETWEKEFFQKKFKQHKLLFFSHALSQRDISQIKECNGLIIFIYSKITAQIIQKLPKLQFIATMSTGYDHIAVDACKRRNIIVTNVPFYGENTVAEHTFGLILSLSRKIPQSNDRTKLNNFSLDGLRGFDLQGKTLGIIGCGHIGQHVARIAKGFGMQLLVYDSFQDKKFAKKIGFHYVPLNKLLSNSEIITLHAPYNKQTHHLLNKNNFKYIKKGSYLINTARGALLETAALVKALESKQIAGAALDVLEGECYIKEEKELLRAEFSKKCNVEDLKIIIEDQLLLRMNNVIITPHNAFNSKEALQRIVETTAENITCFAQKKKQINRIK